MAEPSRRNSGLEHTTTSKSGRSLRNCCSISWPVPTGTVDLVATTVESLIYGVINIWRHLLNGSEHVREIGIAVAPAHRCAHREKHHLRPAHRFGKGHPEAEASRCNVAHEEFVEARLVDRNLAPLQSADAVGILIDASDGPTEVGKADGRNR